jgi:hypothetical protein
VLSNSLSVDGSLAVRLAVVATLAITLLFGLLPLTASAAPGDCPNGSGWVCMYKNQNYAAGGVAQYSISDATYAFNTFDDCEGGLINCGLDNATRSVWNSGNSLDTCHYKNVNYGGARFHTARNTGWWHLDHIGHDKTSSSHKWVAGAASC